MKTKVISVDEALPGMRVANDIYTFNNQLLINSNTPLNDRIITRLKFYSIAEIEIVNESNKKDSDITSNTTENAQTTAKTFSETLKQTGDNIEFKQYNEAVVTFANEFKTSLDDVFVNGKDVDTSSLLSNINNIIDQSKSSVHLLNMLHCMSEYSDHIYTHSINVALICNVFGKWLNFSDENITILTMCGLLHDIGKLSIPIELLEKKERLTPDEFEVIKTHSVKGYQLLKNKTVNEHIKYAALMHHERCDGSGYPNHYQSKCIDKFAKIVAIADVYDAMISPRAYRPALCPFEVIEFFEFEGYQKFEPEYVLTFVKGIVESYLNTTVLLSNGAIGKIVFINKNFLARPIVQLSETEFIDLSTRTDIEITKFL